MKFPFRSALPAILLLIIPLIATAQGPPVDSKTKLIDHILSEIPLVAELNEAPRDIEAQFSQNPLGLSADKNSRMIDLFEEGFIIDSLLKDVEETFSSEFNDDHAQSVNGWLAKESTQKVHAAEEASSTLQGARRRVVRMYELEQDPPSEERQNIIQSLIKATSAVESAIESQTILFRSIVSAFSILSDQRTFSESQIDGIVDNYRLQIQGEMENEIKNEYLITYYDLDNEVLKEFASFYETEAGNWLNATTTQGIQTAYRNAADRFVESVRDDN